MDDYEHLALTAGESIPGSPGLRLSLEATGGTLPSGWVELELEIARGDAPSQAARLCIETAAGTRTLTLPRDEGSGTIRQLFYMPRSINGLALEPGVLAGTFAIRRATLHPRSAAGAMAELVGRRLSRVPRHPRDVVRLAKRAVRLWRRVGLAGVLRKLEANGASASNPADYERWLAAYDTLSDERAALIRQRLEVLSSPPTFSVVMPVYNTGPTWLARALDSVLAQLYPHWELCVADDHSSRPEVREILEAYKQKEPRLRVVYRAENGHISRASNTALELATGDFVALLDHDDELAPHALAVAAEALASRTDAAVLYSDEDKIDEQGRRFEPYFKPGWNSDLFLGQNFVSHLGVYRRDLVSEVGGFRPGFEGSQDYDLALRIVRRCQPEQILHAPHVLYHWRAIRGSTARGSDEKSYAYLASQRALADHLAALGIDAEVLPAHPDCQYHRVRYRLPASPPKVSVVVVPRESKSPVRQNQRGMTTRKARGLQISYPGEVELLVAQSSADATAGEPRARVTAKLGHETKVRERIISVAREGHAEMRALLAREASGELLVFIDDDLEPLTPDWLVELVSQAVRPGVGVVGGMIYGADGSIEHAGYVLNPETILTRAHRHQPQGALGYFGRATLVQNYAATGAGVLAIRREILLATVGFVSGGGMDLAAVDLCLRLRERGLRSVWTPFAELRRAAPACDEHSPVAISERVALGLRERFGALLGDDPCYNPNLNPLSDDFSLAYPPRRRPF